MVVVAVNVNVGGLKTTFGGGAPPPDGGRPPTFGGASPPTDGVATTLLVPAVAPSVQQTPAFPPLFVVVAAVEANAPQFWVTGVSGATTPPPWLTAQPTGTFASSVPLWV